ncbi:MAG: hypothetical protein ABIG99_02695, partial [Patescibacteria group bacterium]
MKKEKKTKTSKALLGLFFSFLFLFLSFSFLPIKKVQADIPCVFTSTLKIGQRGEEIKCLQDSLNIIADGIFG